MNDRLDLSALPKWSYWRVGVPDLIATEQDLCIRAMLDLMRERSLKIELRIEDVPIDPLTFVQHLQEWNASYLMVHLHQVLDPILDMLEGDEADAGAEEFVKLARWLRQVFTSDRREGEGDGETSD